MMPRLLTTVWMLGFVGLVGCNSPLIRSQSPEADDLEHLTNHEADDTTEFVGDLTIPTGMNYLKIEGVALVNGLDGTGSDPSPSPLRSGLIGEMQTHDVSHPERILTSDSNALVVVRAYLPPGVRKGDRFDVKVVLPPKSKSTSLRSGYLLRCRLQEMRVLGNAIHTGHVVGLAQGTVLVDAIFDGGSDEVLETRGRVLGGGQSQISRPLGLVIRGQTTVRKSARIGSVINSRFHKTDRHGKSGVAKPKRDNYIELALHPRYKNNVTRYLRVIQSIVVRETTGERVVRIEALKRRLMEPTMAARAAMQLEAIGDDAAHILLKGLESADPEVRFYSAEALAYLDREEAAAELAGAAADEPAFRWHALTALAAMDHVVAYDALNELLHVASAETRYGAFRALRTRNAADPLVRGESLGGGFAYHVISSDGPPMIHFSKAKRPEIVLFGQRQSLEPPAFLFAGKEIMIKGLKDGRIKLTRFGVGDEEDVQMVCDADVDQLIRSIVKMKGGYAEIAQALHEGRAGGYLESKLVVNALARPGRKYHRDRDNPGDDDETPKIRVANPIPELFSNRLEKGEKKRSYVPEYIAPEPEEKDSADDSFMSRMTGWFSK